MYVQAGQPRKGPNLPLRRTSLPWPHPGQISTGGITGAGNGHVRIIEEFDDERGHPSRVGNEHSRPAALVPVEGVAAVIVIWRLTGSRAMSQAAERRRRAGGEENVNPVTPSG